MSDHHNETPENCTHDCSTCGENCEHAAESLQQALRPGARVDKVIAVVSGKGGVGKSMVTAALGVALARKSMHCCCVDADLGLRDLDMVLGLQSRVVYDMMDVVRHDCKMRSALVSHTRYENLSLLPASQSARAKDMDAEEFERIIRKLKKRYGYILTDAPAGVDRGLCNLIPASDHCILVVTPDDVAIRDAERVLAALDEAAKNHTGVCTLDGSMVDKPMELRARTTLAKAAAAGIKIGGVQA